MSSSDAMATVSLEGTSLSVTGVAAGPATVTVTAMNSAASAYQMFEVHVRDVPPGAVGALPDISLVAGGAPQMINLAEYFSGTALVFGATGTGEAVRVSLAGAQLTVEPAIEGVATVTVNVSNTEGAISASFEATVMTSAAEADAIERSLAAIGAATLSSVQSAFSARFRGHGAAVPAEPSSFADASGGGAFGMLDGSYGGASGAGCTGEDVSPSTSDCGTSISCTGNRGRPVSLCSMKKNPVLVACRTASVLLPLRVTSTRAGMDGRS